jgi:hypothetical protein
MLKIVSCLCCVVQFLKVNEQELKTEIEYCSRAQGRQIRNIYPIKLSGCKNGPDQKAK